MSKVKQVLQKFRLILLLTWFLFNNLCPGLALTESSPVSQRYAELSFVQGLNPDLTLYINKKSLNIDLLKTNNIRIRVKTSPLYNAKEQVSSLKISMYELFNGRREFISSQNITVFKKTKQSRLVSMAAGFFASPVKQVEFDIFDTEGNLINTYSASLSATNLDAQVLGGAGVNSAAAECDYTSFDDCQLDYLFDRITFEAKPQKQISTRIVKSEEGLYKVTIPVSMSPLLRRNVRARKSAFNTSSEGSVVGFGKTIAVSNIRLGPNAQQFGTLSYDPTGDQFTFGPTSATTPVLIGVDGKVGIGVTPVNAFLDVRGGDGITPSMIIEPGILSSTPVNGALEFNGAHAYFTIGDQRAELLSRNNVIVDPSTGRIDPGSLSPNVVLTTTSQTLHDKVLVDTTFEGSIEIPASASEGYLLTSDATGNANWRLAKTLGINVNTVNDTGIAIGSNLTSNASYAMVMGKGNDANDQLKNNITNSLMIGIDSNVATMFVKAASGTNTLGRVGVGTVDPQYLVDVNGTLHADSIHLNGPLTFGSNDITFTTTGATNVTLPTSGTLATLAGTEALTNKTITSPTINSGATITGDVTVTGGNVGIGTLSTGVYALNVVGTAGLSTGTAWTNTSDIRLKNIDGDYKYGLAEILKLHSVRFHYKESNPRQMPSDVPLIGFIAQEVQPIFPEAVNEGKDGYLDFNIHPINVAMVNAVQELKQEKDKDVKQLQLENEQLKQQNDKLTSYLCAKDPTAVFCNK